VRVEAVNIAPSRLREVLSNLIGNARGKRNGEGHENMFCPPLLNSLVKYAPVHRTASLVISARMRPFTHLSMPV